MFSRTITRVARRAQSQALGAGFTNKHGFNTNPPPVHEFWTAWNSSVVFAFVPVFLAVGYAGKYMGSNIGGYEGLYQFASSDKSPMKELSFGEAQTRN